MLSSSDEGDQRLRGLGKAGRVGVPPPHRKALARRGALAAKQILFQTSPLAPEGVGNSGPSHREARGAPGAPPGFPLPPRAGWGSHCRRTPRLSGRASAPALLSGPQAGERQERETEDRGGEGETRKAEATRREGAGRDGGARFSTAPADSARPGRARAPRGPGWAGGGLEWGARGSVVYLPRAGVLAGGRAVSGGARSGWPGPCGALGTAAAAEGHREEGASHGGAPRPPPASERDDEGGAAATRRAPAGARGGGDGAAPPSPLPSAAPSPDAVGSQSLACDPRPPSGLESPILPPPIRPLRCGPGRGSPSCRQGPAPSRPRPCRAPR